MSRFRPTTITAVVLLVTSLISSADAQTGPVSAPEPPENRSVNESAVAESHTELSRAIAVLKPAKVEGKAKIPALVSMTDADNQTRVIELQATIGTRLAAMEEEIEFDRLAVSRIVAPQSANPTDAWTIELANGDVLTLHPAITVSDGSTLLKLDGKVTPIADDKIVSLRFPTESHRILKVDGNYGPKTYSAVYLYQITENLEPTGEVDAVTLERLEPLVPPNFILATVLRSIESRGDGPGIGSAWWAKQVSSWVVVALILIMSIVVHLVTRNFASSTTFLSKWIFTPTSSPWFTALKDKRFFLRMAHFAPALFIIFSANLFPSPISAGEDPFPYLDVFENWHDSIERFGLAYCGLVCMLVGLAFVDAARVVYTSKQSENNPIDGIIGFAKRFVVGVGIVLIAAGLAKRNPMYFVGGLGAFMAVIMLVFKDTILGLAASVQIIGHDMVKVGDWIEMPKYGVDGYVTAMSLTTIKVQNFDKTIASIPTQAVLTDSFKNWRGMQETGARRIKRSILIDMNTVKPCDAEMCDRFENIDLLRDYIKGKREELKNHLLENDVTISPVNGRWLTNIGTFRVYVESYLRWHPQISTELTCLVRHLPMDAEGLPMEIYCFCTETNLAAFEQIQADVFDHLLSVLPEFDLRVFQNPREFDYEHVEQRYQHRIDGEAFAVANGIAAPSRISQLKMFVAEQNKYLASNSRARVDTAVRKVQDEVDRDGLDATVTVRVENRRITLDRE